MTNNQNEPREFDTVLGGEKPPPLQGALLCRVEEVKQRKSPYIKIFNKTRWTKNESY